MVCFFFCSQATRSRRRLSSFRVSLPCPRLSMGALNIEIESSWSFVSRDDEDEGEKISLNFSILFFTVVGWRAIPMIDDDKLIILKSKRKRDNRTTDTFSPPAGTFDAYNRKLNKKAVKFNLQWTIKLEKSHSYRDWARRNKGISMGKLKNEIIIQHRQNVISHWDFNPLMFERHFCCGRSGFFAFLLEWHGDEVEKNVNNIKSEGTILCCGFGNVSLACCLSSRNRSSK